uniref:Uncharacterized protein n=1 Tax=Glossina austeni TaxID=7395 RepID=A0A1A9UUP8_GLOAU
MDKGSPQECKKPQLLECSKLLANNTRTYLDAYHLGVNLNATSLYYECLYEELKVGSADVHYRGCTYDNINGCQLQLRPQFAAPSQQYI